MSTLSSHMQSCLSILKLKKELYEIIASHSGQAFKKIEKDSDRDYWMTAEEAKTYGMIDELLVREVKEIK
jgi:ATP-dependent Clp protease protease subunit